MGARGFASPVPGPDDDSLRLLFHEIKDVLASQRAAGERVDDKAASLVTFSALVLGLVTTGLARVGAQPLPLWSLATTGAGLALLLGSIAGAAFAYRPIEYAMGLDAKSIRVALAYDVTRHDFLVQAIQAYHDGIHANAQAVAAKARWLRRSLWFLFFPGMLLAVAGGLGFIGLITWEAQ